jgi:hypothetical protein
MDGKDRAALELIERAAAQNLRDYVHAVQTAAPALGAAAISCAGGVAAFMGLGSPLTAVKGAGPEVTDDDIDAAQNFFGGFGVDNVVFELAPWVSGETAARLGRRGYGATGCEDVVVRDPPFDAPVPGWRVSAVQAADWPQLTLAVNGDAASPPWRALMEASALLPGAIHFGVLDDSGAWIACAQLAPAAGAGLFANDATLPRARGRGAQTATIHERLCAAASLALLMRGGRSGARQHFRT